MMDKDLADVVVTAESARMLLEYLFSPDGLDAELAEEAHRATEG